MTSARPLLLRPAPDNALLRAATPRVPRIRRTLAAAFWMLFYAVPTGVVFYLAYLIGQARLQ
ncbi:hypothetical protein [Burkholderia stagnalis]|uniref:Uncharacterized protein n=1 Tax=Burkholderia stagnalis TaxID=1503054 RepID=A0A108ITL6_9BURK|nr:hypothetical protein [Burkholderia stagnalis]KVZ03347.1 hypothetical protein WT35_28045 [Burkholderia stagnalis]KWA48356.1 hypothetical protein WT43_32365 [Burkholderia stagnalis]KWA51682.1 hypothetical protein WT42_16520 [Burkholderia stagnalis]KWA62663.1 hypothetical protein WT44_13620 [Burkholderia stagnalis]KWC98302.1 hypothetical protein WT46_23605 [Burkholderia stagnalis]